MAAPSNKSEIAYQRENELLVKFKGIVQSDDLSKEEYRAAIDELLKSYTTLLSDTKLLTSVGDRLQRKLKGANMLLQQQSEEIQRVNETLQLTNVELKNTIDELTKARASRKAQTFILIFVVVLMVATEVMEEFFIEKFVDTYFTDWEKIFQFMIGLIPKALIVMLLKPIEGYTERYFIRQAQRDEAKQKSEIQEKFAAS
ncbi:MAG: hypothetical protein KF690_04530 [Bacteroidetes bacterium]|nr:hypothetical protein [Bacteroidota bacterium]